MTDERKLTLSDAVLLGRVIDVVSHGERITWTPDGGETILRGTARSIGDEDFGLNIGDVRDAFVRVTNRSGTEHAIPISYMMRWFKTGAIKVGW